MMLLMPTTGLNETHSATYAAGWRARLEFTADGASPIRSFESLRTHSSTLVWRAKRRLLELRKVRKDLFYNLVKEINGW